MGAVKARMDNLLFKVLLPAAVAVMAGCGRSSPDGPYVDLPDSATVISVNGACYAKSYVEQNVTVMANLMVLAGARTEDLEMTVDPIGYRFRLMNSMVERELLIQESAKRGISLDEADVRRRENQLAAEFTRSRRLDFEQLEQLFGGLAELIRDNVRRDALAEKVRDVFFAAVRERRDLAAKRAHMTKANAALASLATNAWRSIVRGNDFATVGRKLQEMKREVTFSSEADCDLPAAAALKVGAMSEPMAAEDGIALVKAMKPVGAPRRFARICVRLAPLPEPSSVWADLPEPLPEDEESAYAAWLERLKQSATIKTAAL